MRGSRKHVLDWTSRVEFASEFLTLVDGAGCQVRVGETWLPQGYADPEEARLDVWGPRAAPLLADWDELANWWLVHRRGANRPNWDLVVSCEIDGVPGLALVEAKAHVNELETAGKRVDHDASMNSKANHERIGVAIEEARVSLDQTHPGVHISRDRHYQLSNRVAFSWKLGTMGVPTLLLYLGFLGDDGMGSPSIQDSDHWGKVMASYVKPVLPDGFVDSWIPCGPARMKMIVRSRTVIQASVR